MNSILFAKTLHKIVEYYVAILTKIFSDDEENLGFKDESDLETTSYRKIKITLNVTANISGEIKKKLRVLGTPRVFNQLSAGNIQLME